MFEDTIFINKLKIDTVIGIHDWEQKQTQQLLLDIKIYCDISNAAQDDDIGATISYSEVAKDVTSKIQNHKFLLIERVAEEVAQIILKHDKAHQVEVTIYKPSAVDNAETVGVQIKRFKPCNY